MHKQTLKAEARELGREQGGSNMQALTQVALRRGYRTWQALSAALENVKASATPPTAFQVTEHAGVVVLSRQVTPAVWTTVVLERGPQTLHLQDAVIDPACGPVIEQTRRLGMTVTGLC